MVMEQYFQEPAVENLNQDGISLAKWKSIAADGPEDKSSSGGLECNICLDFVQDPVVTFCGHLYCWPCIYKWLHLQSPPSEDPYHHQPQCPVCKAELSEESLIPLYGRGLTSKPSEGKARQLGIAIPQRPPSPKWDSRGMPSPATPSISRAVPQLQQFGYMQQPQMHNQYANPGSYIAAPTFGLGGTGSPIAYHPVIGMLGEMVLARMFGNQTAINSYPNSYQLIGGGNPRIRRQVMQADKSLSRIINFLFCCMILCVLLF